MKAVIFAAHETQDQEFLYPYYRLQEVRFEVQVATVGDKTVLGKYGIPIVPTCKIEELMDCDVLIVPGGWGAEKLRSDPQVIKYVQKTHAQKKPIGSVCHGPWVLISAGIVKGKRMTCYPGMKDDLINAGAIYVDENLVVDGNLITAPHYRNNPEFMAAVLAKL